MKDFLEVGDFPGYPSTKKAYQTYASIYLELVNDNSCKEKYDMIDWRDKESTEKQLEMIRYMKEFSEFPLPPFTGKTRGEAYDWIQKNWDLAHESSWAIEHGY